MLVRMANVTEADEMLFRVLPMEAVFIHRFSTLVFFWHSLFLGLQSARFEFISAPFLGFCPFLFMRSLPLSTRDKLFSFWPMFLEFVVLLSSGFPPCPAFHFCSTFFERTSFLYREPQFCQDSLSRHYIVFREIRFQAFTWSDESKGNPQVAETGCWCEWPT